MQNNQKISSKGHTLYLHIYSGTCIIYILYTAISDVSSLWNRAFPTWNQCKKWVEQHGYFFSYLLLSTGLSTWKNHYKITCKIRRKILFELHSTQLLKTMSIPKSHTQCHDITVYFFLKKDWIVILNFFLKIFTLEKNYLFIIK